MIALVCLDPAGPSRAAKAATALARGLANVAQAVAVCAGGPPGGPSLDWASRAGCFARVLHLDDSSLDGAGFMTVGMALAEVARHVRADLVIAGQHSDLEGQGLVPAALAHQWDAPLIARVGEVRLPAPDTRQAEITVAAGGRRATLSCRLPVVLTTAGPYQEASVPAQDAAAPATETVTLAQLALDPSRLVPRPELLGTQLPVPADRLRSLSVDQAAQLLLRRP